MVASGRPSATSLQVKSNSLRPTQSIAGGRLEGLGRQHRGVGADEADLAWSGFCCLMASATLQSFFSDGVEVLMMT